MKIIHFVQDISNESGGLKSAVFGINKAIGEKKVLTIIYTFSRLDNFEKNPINGIYLRSFRNLLLFKPRKIKNFFIQFYKDFFIKNSSIIHIHGLWTITPLLGFLISKILNIPYCLSPHGMLMPLAKKW